MQDPLFVLYTAALSMITPPIITSVRPLNSTSFTVNWEATGLDDNYILVTWTNLRTGLKEGSVTVSNNTNSYTVKRTEWY